MKPAFDTLFQHSFCINLDRRPDRWEEAQKEFEEQGLCVTRWSAVDGKLLADEEVQGFTCYDMRMSYLKGALGCLRSHRDVLEYSLRKGYDPAAVFEDDVMFCPNAIACLEQWYPQIPDDWEAVFLGGVGKTSSVSSNVQRLKEGNFAHAIVYRSSFIQEFLPLLHDETRQNDDVWNSLLASRPVYIVEPMIAIQRPGYSDLRGRKETIIRRFDVEMWKGVDPRTPGYYDYVKKRKKA